MPTAEANGLSIYYTEQGSGFPLVLAHGGSEDHSAWASQVGALSEKYRVIVWDRRNCGKTEPKDTPEAYDVWVDDLKAFLDVLEIDQAHIGGVSYGGLLTLEFAIRFPARTRTAIIVSATGQGFDPDGDFTVSFPDRSKDLGAVQVPSLVVQGLQDEYFPPAVGRELAERLPQSELVLIEAGHGVNEESPDEFNKAVLRFLSKQT